MNTANLDTPPAVAAPVAPPIHTAEDVRICRTWSRFYRRRGYNGFPSRRDRKAPMVRYAEYWEREFPAAQFERFDTGSMQLMTGRRWGLVVVDLDGPEGVAHWSRVATGVRKTWVTHSGGHGRHLWFSVPTSGPPIPSGRVWGEWEPAAREGKGDWRKHVAVEVIADRKLIMVPPSIHPNGRRYRFLAGHSPEEVARPAPLPAWVLAMPILQAPRPEPAPAPMTPRKGPGVPVAGRYGRDAVLDGIPDKVAVAGEYGLRVASRSPNGSGWCSCHAIGRDDRSPSASIHAESGTYWEPGERASSFFDLLVRLGAFGDWREAVAGMGERYGIPQLKQHGS